MIKRIAILALALACVVTHANARGHGHGGAHFYGFRSHNTRGYNWTTHVYAARQRNGGWLKIYPSGIEGTPSIAAHPTHNRMNGL
jgi:hypothetical protein